MHPTIKLDKPINFFENPTEDVNDLILTTSKASTSSAKATLEPTSSTPCVLLQQAPTFPPQPTTIRRYTLSRKPMLPAQTQIHKQ